jgi:isoleucyl-tRNA synthetase
MPSDQPYPDVEQQPRFPAIEESILARWAESDTFKKSITQRDGAQEFVFYDGPPFANGLPHFGHLLTSFVKDTVPRYQTMRGKKVDRRFGWDCHGLPAEMEAERQLGFSGKAAILEYGIDRFNDYCRESVLRYTGEWRGTVDRVARWVDFDNQYRTLDLTYMESVMWAFKQLYEKGLVYEGRRVLPYCWECETPLSNFETRLDDSYRDRTDTAVTVMFELEGFEKPTKLLVWTTTPWTLPSNLAVAVGPEIEYAIFEENGTRYVLGAQTVDKYKQQLQNAERVGSITGAELIGRKYAPLMPYFDENPTAFKVIPATHVETSEGTGAVHMAPWYGEEDFYACIDAGIEFIRRWDNPDLFLGDPVDTRGRYSDLISDYTGMQVFDANSKIADRLKAEGKLIKREQYVHSYPHCWRTDTPLIYRAMSSWFVEVTKIKARMVELNQNINWIPENVRDGAFGKWLEGARDWGISRNRFWGSPIPVWISDDPKYPRIDVYGSLNELERDFGVRPTDLHRPAIDNLTRPNPDDPSGKSTMRRVEDVLDCWFESGSMPFAQVHYPFENKEWFENHFPADFIVEYTPQTRGWFYTLHVLATALFDTNAFKTCIAHGNVLGDDGRKMSKRLRNYPALDEVFDTLGADATRWALFSSPVLRGGETLADRKLIVEASRQVLVPIWNAWYFFSMYANIDGLRGHIRTDQTNLLDRYVLAKTAELRNIVTDAMDNSDPYRATQAVTRYIDALNNWYVRRSRDRFWRHLGPDAIDEDKQDAYDTLYTVLRTLCRIVAPLLPMVSEEIYTSLTGEESVHLTDWVAEDELSQDPELVAAMDLVRDVCSEVLSIRKAQKLRVRLPLQSITVASPDSEQLRPFVDLITDEVNVKEVLLSADAGTAGELTLAVNPRVAGPRLGGSIQRVLAAARQGDWKQTDDGSIFVAGERLNEDEYELRLKPQDEKTSRPLPNYRGIVTLDINVTPELEQEGLARDIIRLVQGARRDAGLHVSDHIELNVKTVGPPAEAVKAHADYIVAQTLTERLTVGTDETDTAEMHEHIGEVDGIGVTIRLRRNI